jgi:hypothetical protein
MPSRIGWHITDLFIPQISSPLQINTMFHGELSHFRRILRVDYSSIRGMIVS